jgi:hypothetical protein
MGISRLRFVEYLADEVHQALDLVDMSIFLAFNHDGFIMLWSCYQGGFVRKSFNYSKAA